MKKVISLMMIVALVFCSVSMVFAQNEYSFDLQYSGNIIKNVEKEGVVTLRGVNATPHTNVRIKVDITGPATPQILATDSAGIEYNIAQIGYWGPAGGFAVGGDFVNETQIRATFPEEGTYVTTLSLIDVANGNAVIASRTFTTQVYEDATTDNVVNNTVENNMIEELPKTGTSVWEYALYIIILAVTLWGIGTYLNKKRFA